MRRIIVNVVTQTYNIKTGDPAERRESVMFARMIPERQRDTTTHRIMVYMTDRWNVDVPESMQEMGGGLYRMSPGARPMTPNQIVELAKSGEDPAVRLISHEELEAPAGFARSDPRPDPPGGPLARRLR